MSLLVGTGFVYAHHGGDESRSLSKSLSGFGTGNNPGFLISDWGDGRAAIV